MERLQVPKQMELALLLDIVLEASKWRVSEGDERDPLRMEVEDRLSRLLPAEEEPEPQAVDAARANKFNVSWHGKKRWVPKEWVQKVPYSGSPTGYRYEPVDEYRAEFLAKFGEKEDDNAVAKS